MHIPPAAPTIPLFKHTGELKKIKPIKEHSFKSPCMIVSLVIVTVVGGGIFCFGLSSYLFLGSYVGHYWSAALMVGGGILAVGSPLGIVLIVCSSMEAKE